MLKTIPGADLRVAGQPEDKCVPGKPAFIADRWPTRKSRLHYGVIVTHATYAIADIKVGERHRRDLLRRAP
jgi:hypothetical protein